jgi:hypothetical protein
MAKMQRNGIPNLENDGRSDFIDANGRRQHNVDGLAPQQLIDHLVKLNVTNIVSQEKTVYPIDEINDY